MQNSRTVFGMPFVCTLLILSVFRTNQVQAQAIPLDTAVHTGTLANGFTYYIRHNEEPRNRVYLYLVNKVGSVLEDNDQQGLAHFMEHMDFNGTAHFPKNELVSYLQKSGVRFGADLNAYTGFDETVYQLPIPADDPAILDNGFQIMRDWAQNASLDSVEIDKERGVVLEEQRLGRGAAERLERIYFPVLLNQSRYAERLPIGKVDILKNFNHAAIRNFYHDWYRPNLQALIVVGDIDPAATEVLIRERFADLKAPVNERPRTKYSATLTGENHFLALTDPERPSTDLEILIKHSEERMTTEPEYLHSMQRQLFNQMLSERLAALAETPDLPYVQAEASIGGFMAGLDAFSVDIVLKKGSMEAGFGKVWQTIEQVKRFGFTEPELARARLNYLSGMESRFREKNKTPSESFVGEYQRLFLNREASPGIAWEYQFVKDHIAGISLDQVNALVKEYIAETNRDILILAPASEKNSLPDSATVAAWMNLIKQEDIIAFHDEMSGRPLLTEQPTPGKIQGTKAIPALGITELTLSNGLRVILKPTNFKNDEIRFAAFAPGGSSVYPDADFQNAKNAGLIAGFGLGDFRSADLQKQLSGKNLSVEPFVGEREQGLEGSSTPVDLETALQLVYLYFTAPRRDSISFRNLISSSREMIATRYSDPNNIFGDTVTRVLGNYNFRRQPMTVEKLSELDLDKLYRIYRERFSDASNFNFIFVGNFNTDSLRPLLEKWLGSLPATHQGESARDLNIHIPQGLMTKIVRAGTEDKATVKMVFSGDYKFNEENNLILQALKEVLLIRVTEHLREDEGEVYSPNVQVSYNKFPKNRFAFTVAFGCAPANADHLMASVEKEMAELRKNGPSAEDLNKFKAEYRRLQELQQSENAFWLSYLFTQYGNHERPSPLTDKLKLLDKLTPASLQKAAQKYFSGANGIRFKLLPLK